MAVSKVVKKNGNNLDVLISSYMLCRKVADEALGACDAAAMELAIAASPVKVGNLAKDAKGEVFFIREILPNPDEPYYEIRASKLRKDGEPSDKEQKLYMGTMRTTLIPVK